MSACNNDLLTCLPSSPAAQTLRKQGHRGEGARGVPRAGTTITTGASTAVTRPQDTLQAGLRRPRILFLGMEQGRERVASAGRVPTGALRLPCTGQADHPLTTSIRLLPRCPPRRDSRLQPVPPRRLRSRPSSQERLAAFRPECSRTRRGSEPVEREGRGGGGGPRGGARGRAWGRA